MYPYQETGAMRVGLSVCKFFNSGPLRKSKVMKLSSAIAYIVKVL